eukprot:349593-Chlamydomonas_euryale.AAC.2
MGAAYTCVQTARAHHAWVHVRMGPCGKGACVPCTWHALRNLFEQQTDHTVCAQVQACQRGRGRGALWRHTATQRGVAKGSRARRPPSLVRLPDLALGRPPRPRSLL